ncbi:MAG: hypothetical protein JXR67_00965 [Bacteroidales bacterium]|nr:hypothetical protein [Bacteroidales bacterium]
MLFSNKFKIPGLILLITGLIFSILYFSINLRFELPVFAVVSSFMETKLFTTFSTNVADELTMIFLFSGLFILTMSEEKDENELLKAARQKAVKIALIVNSAIIAFAILFIYGTGFMAVTIANPFLPFIIYLLLFSFLKRRRN